MRMIGGLVVKFWIMVRKYKIRIVAFIIDMGKNRICKNDNKKNLNK